MAVEELAGITGNSGSKGRRHWVSADHPRYKWIALTNTTIGILIATINSSIVLISLPGIFNGIRMNPLQPGNISYLLWVLMGYMLVTAVLVVALGRLGDMWGRVRIYNAGFLIFTITSVILSLDPFTGSGGALWLIGWRIVQAVGGSMLMANSAAILTDAFPQQQRGMALGVNMVAGIAGAFVGLVLGGALVAWDWRSVFWVNVPVGVIGTIWAYRSLHETGVRTPGRMDWWGNLTFGIGLTVLLVGITYGIQPYGGHTMGWTNPWVLAGLIGGVVLLALFCVIEMTVAEPMFPMRLFADPAFAGGNLATLLGAAARGGLQFMLIIWLQGIWLPLHGYDYADTPLWAGIYLLPLTVGFLAAGPIAGHLSDLFGARWFAAGGFVVMAISFAGLLLLPTDFTYWVFALLVFLNGLGGGLFAAPNTSIIMSSVPADARGAASGMRATFQNAGMVLSMGMFFSLMIAGLAGSMPGTLMSGLTAQGVPPQAAHTISSLPPVGVLFAAFLGYNPIEHLLGPTVLGQLPADHAAKLTGRQFFPDLVSQPFHHGLVVVFAMAIVMSVIAAVASLPRPRAMSPSISEPITAATHPEKVPMTESDTTTESALTAVPGLRGTIRDRDGRPMPDAALTLIDHAGHQRSRTSAAADGTYTMPIPEPGTYVLITSAAGCQPDAVAFTATTEALPRHDITLSSTTSLQGCVHDQFGEPVADATLVITDRRGEVITTSTTTSDGEFTAHGLCAGTFTATASARGYNPAATTTHLDADPARRCEIVLTRTGRVVGTIRDAHTEIPIANAAVHLLGPGNVVVAATTTAEDGTYELTDIVLGDYTLRVTGYPPMSARAVLNGAGNSSLDLHLEHP